MNTSIRSLMIAALALVGFGAQAATISLQAPEPVVDIGSTFNIDLLIDATDAPGVHPGLFGGQVVIDYDPTRLEFVGFTTALPLFSPVTEGSEGERNTITLGFDHGPDIGVIGVFEFTAIGEAGDVTTIGVRDEDDFMGTFVSYLPTYQTFYPEMIDARIELRTVIPLPGAAWLLMSALGLGAGARRLSARRADSPSA